MLFHIEIICFFLSFFYILYFIGDKLFLRYRKYKIKALERFHKQAERKQKQAKNKLNKNFFQKKKAHKQEEKIIQQIDPKVSEKIRNIIQRAEVNISRGYYESARILIVEGLAIKKDDKDLNITLAKIYEHEKKYQNAEYIYKEMIDIHGADESLLVKLGHSLALQGKNEESFIAYEQAFEKKSTNLEVLDTLSHLGLELKKNKKSLKYANLFLKQKPRDSEKLGIKGYCHEVLGETHEAIVAYRKLLEVQPYNSEVQERVVHLESQ